MCYMSVLPPRGRLGLSGEKLQAELPGPLAVSSSRRTRSSWATYAWEQIPACGIRHASRARPRRSSWPIYANVQDNGVVEGTPGLNRGALFGCGWDARPQRARVRLRRRGAHHITHYPTACPGAVHAGCCRQHYCRQRDRARRYDGATQEPGDRGRLHRARGPTEAEIDRTPPSVPATTYDLVVSTARRLPD